MYENLKYNKKIDKDYFKTLTQMSLEEKVKLSKEIIIEFYENIDKSNGEKVYIACSFGKDSLVIVDLIRSIYPDIPIIFMDSGYEYKGVYEIAKKYDNVVTLKPEHDMKWIIENEGYILPIGKSKSKMLQRARKHIAEEKWESSAFKSLTGRGKYGGKSLFNQSTACKHLIAPFPISHKCDYYLKDQANKKYRKEHNYKYYFTGLTYDESFMRRATIVRDGFNIMKEKSRPIGHWNTNDVLQYIVENNIELPDSYGEIVCEDGKYRTTLYDRTGCYCCPCGSHMKNPNQYQLLYDYDRDAWEHTIFELGFGKVCDYFEIPYYPEKEKTPKEDNQKRLI